MVSASTFDPPLLQPLMSSKTASCTTAFCASTNASPLESSSSTHPMSAGQEHVDVAKIRLARTSCTNDASLSFPPSVSFISNTTVLGAASLHGRGTAISLISNNQCHQNLGNDLCVMIMMWEGVQCNAKSDPKRTRTLNLSPIAISTKGSDYTTMIVKTFLDIDGSGKKISDCSLRPQVAELNRPVSYFWSVHDFVMGLRDALRGHAFLVEHGLLHHGLSERNIALGCHPNAVRGQIKDFDHAIRCLHPNQECLTTGMMTSLNEGSSRVARLTGNPRKAYCTANLAYTSLNVLLGNKSTGHDDVESFFYILILFFLRYNGPTERWQSLRAMRHGFTLESKSPASACSWPPPYESWSGHSDLDMAISSKTALFDHSSFVDFLFPLAKALIEWHPNDLTSYTLHLIANCWTLFVSTSGSSTGRPLRVRHNALISEFSQWLEKTPLPKECNRCPFFDENGAPMV